MTEIELIINQFILEEGKLYTLPELYNQLDEKIRSNKASIEEIGELLTTDAALTAKILKMANSAIYGFPAEITNITRALNLLGLKEVKNLILMDTVAQNFCKDDKYNVIQMEDFWRRSIYIALIAKKLAKRVKHPEPDRLFLCGIMSRIGQLVSCLTRRKEVLTIAHQTINDPETSEFTIEANILGFTYNEVSSQLLARWKVPEDITVPLGTLHQPLDYPENVDDNYRQDLYILHMATVYSHLLNLEDENNNADPEHKKESSHDPAIDDIYLNAIDRQINQNLNIDKNVIDDILFEIEIDAMEILFIVFPKSALIY